MEKPLISIIIPVYKTEKYLRRCVDSVRNQTYSNLEIILVDDGSPDRCGEICDALASEDLRIRVIHKENGGLSSARNAALDVMAGKYVGFIDSDDWVDLNMYQELLGLIQHYGVKIAACAMQPTKEYCDDTQYDTNSQIEIYTRMEAQLAQLQNLKITNSFCDKLFDSTLFSTIRFPVGEIFEDINRMHYVLELTDGVVYNPRHMYFYWMEGSSITRRPFCEEMFNESKAARKRAQFYKEKHPEIYETARRAYIRVALHQIWLSRNASDCKESRQKLISEMQQPLPKQTIKAMSKGERIRLYALRIGGFPTFYFVTAMIEMVKKIRRDNRG